MIVVSSSEQDPPTSYVYPKSALAGEISYRFWRGQQEVIIMIEADADPDGYIEEIFLYSDGEMLQTSDGNFYQTKSELRMSLKICMPLSLLLKNLVFLNLKRWLKIILELRDFPKMKS